MKKYLPKIANIINTKTFKSLEIYVLKKIMMKKLFNNYFKEKCLSI